MRHILITGGAEFIGSHLADELLRHGYHVRALDNLAPQVHGANGAAGLASGSGNGNGNPEVSFRPSYLDREVELICGDVRDPQTIRRALTGIDAVFHLAAAVGVGQSCMRSPITQVSTT